MEIEFFGSVMRSDIAWGLRDVQVMAASLGLSCGLTRAASILMGFGTEHSRIDPDPSAINLASGATSDGSGIAAMFTQDQSDFSRGLIGP